MLWEKHAGGAPALVLIVLGRHSIAGLLILLCGCCSLALISRQCWLGLSALLRIAASLLGLSNGHLRLGSVPVWLSIREGASVDCDLERVMLIGQPGIDNLGPEAGAQTTASSTGFERYSSCDCSEGLWLALFFLWPATYICIRHGTSTRSGRLTNLVSAGQFCLSPRRDRDPLVSWPFFILLRSSALRELIWYFLLTRCWLWHEAHCMFLHIRFARCQRGRIDDQFIIWIAQNCSSDPCILVRTMEPCNVSSDILCKQEARGATTRALRGSGAAFLYMQCEKISDRSHGEAGELAPEL